MKKLLLVFIFVVIALTNQVFAESLPPNQVVYFFIRALQQDDLETLLKVADLEKIAAHPHHAKTLEQLKEFFEDLDISKIKYQKIEYDSWDKNIIVRIAEPINYDFDLELQDSYNEEVEGYYIYKVVSVHP